jgi:hypothetical protein
MQSFQRIGRAGDVRAAVSDCIGTLIALRLELETTSTPPTSTPARKWRISMRRRLFRDAALSLALLAAPVTVRAPERVNDFETPLRRV